MLPNGRLPEIEKVSEGWFGASNVNPEQIGQKGDYADQFATTGNFKFVNRQSVTNSMEIEVVRNVDIEPKFRSIYIGQSGSDFHLEIMHGSGHFDYKVNDTDIVRDFAIKGRDITFKPNGIGSIKIEIFDHEIPDS